MNQLPRPDDLESLVIRTDFGDNAAWGEVRRAIAMPYEGFQAFVRFVDDRRWDRLTIDGLLDLVPEGSDLTFLFLVDSSTVYHPDHPVLVVDLFHQRGRFFRVVPSALWGVQNNLIISNMDWEDFAESADGDGIFRGFPH